MIRARARDEAMIRRCLEAAAAAPEEAPIGAALVCEGEVVALSANRVEATGDPTAHAEALVLREAAARLGRRRLAECELYVTLEPCPMCAGAIVLARLRRLVFGAWEPKTGAFGSKIDLRDAPGLGPPLEVVAGVLEGDCAEALRTYFERLRARA